MEKLANKSMIKHNIKFYIFLIYYIGYSNLINAQTDNFIKGKLYTIDSISVTGLQNFSDKTVISYSGLRKGKEIRLPGEETTGILNKLWNLDLFSDINFYVTKVSGDKISIELAIEELPTLSEFKINGIKKSKTQNIIEETDLKKGKKLSESFLTNTKNYIKNKYKKEVFFDTKVSINTIKDSIDKNTYKMLVNIDKGPRIKIKNISFNGNEIHSDNKLKRKLKNTKQKRSIRFWKKSKYIIKEFKEDKENLIDFYKEKGYRDARVLSDSLIRNVDNSISLKINIEEGKKYYFGDIRFIGNTVYFDNQLKQILGIQKGDAYNGVLLKKRIADTSKPDGQDITNLYQNSGYLFSNINAVEVSAVQDTIDF